MSATILVYQEVLDRIIKFKPEAEEAINSMIMFNNHLEFYNVDINIVEFLSKKFDIPFGCFVFKSYPFQGLAVNIKDGDYVLFPNAPYLGIYLVKEKINSFSLTRCGKEYDLIGDNLNIPSFRPINDIGDELWDKWNKIPLNISSDNCLFGDGENYKQLDRTLSIYPVNELTRPESGVLYEYSIERPVLLEPMNFGDITMYFDFSCPFGSYTIDEVNTLINYIRISEASGVINPTILHEKYGINEPGYYIMKSSGGVDTWIKNFE